VSSATPLPRTVTGREQRACPRCGGGLRLSHREYAGNRRSVPVLRCPACGAEVRGAPQDDDTRFRSLPARRRPLPEGGQPDNFVLDSATAERLRQLLGGEGADPES
jgi:hypothetical protein